MDPKFTILIVNYNTAEYVERCIASIGRHTARASFEIIVVDNSDEPVLAEREDPNYRYIRTGSNLGFGMANNIGARHARGEYLLFVNPDICFTGDVIARIEQELAGREQDPVIGVNLTDVDHRPCYSCGNFPSFKTELMECFLLHRHKWLAAHAVCVRVDSRQSEPMEVDYVTGALFCMKKSRFMALEGFSKDIFLYYEDTELMFRHRRGGGRVFLITEALATHADGVSTKRNPDFKIEQTEVGRAEFYRTRYSGVKLAAINTIRILHLVLLAAARRRLAYTRSIKHYVRFGKDSRGVEQIG